MEILKYSGRKHECPSRYQQEKAAHEYNELGSNFAIYRFKIEPGICVGRPNAKEGLVCSTVEGRSSETYRQA